MNISDPADANTLAFEETMFSPPERERRKETRVHFSREAARNGRTYSDPNCYCGRSNTYVEAARHQQCFHCGGMNPNVLPAPGGP